MRAGRVAPVPVGALLRGLLEQQPWISVRAASVQFQDHGGHPYTKATRSVCLGPVHMVPAVSAVTDPGEESGAIRPEAAPHTHTHTDIPSAFFENKQKSKPVAQTCHQPVTNVCGPQSQGGALQSWGGGLGEAHS